MILYVMKVEVAMLDGLTTASKPSIKSEMRNSEKSSMISSNCEEE